MAHSRTDDMRREPQGLSKYLPESNVRQTDSQTRFRGDTGIARYLTNNQKEKQS